MRLCLERIDIITEDEPDEYKDVELSDSGRQVAETLKSAQVAVPLRYYGNRTQFD